jgi:CDP-paratose 2-epimerase
MKFLITGSSGLIGGEAVEYFEKQGHLVIGVDNNMRREFFGEAGDTSWNLHRIFNKTKKFQHVGVDIRDRSSLEHHVFKSYSPFDVVIHCAAQPSHDKAKDIPIIDFEVNALGTINLLELTRLYCPSSVFIFMSTNKVYGDAPNEYPLRESETRWEYVDRKSIDETCRIDHTTHSIFGASKVAADIMVQEYGRYFGMNTCVFRGGCLTGPNHSGVALHGFLSYLVRCAVLDIPYTVYGYKGKQVRDNIHSYDVIRAMECVIKHPRPGSVYNMGGGVDNNISVLETINFLGKYLGRPIKWEYSEGNRIGDHICYISDLTKFKSDYPEWSITKSIEDIIVEIIGRVQASSMITERYIPGDGEDERFEAYAKVLVPKCAGRVLDIGCGHGYLTKRIATQQSVKEITGTDKTIANTRNDHKIFYWEITSEALAKTNNMGAFQTILSSEHMEHLAVEFHTPLLEWIKRHLSSDGKFVGSMPVPDDPQNPNKYHLKTYTMEEWKVILDHHFNRVEIGMVYKDCYYWSAAEPENVIGEI